MSTNDDDEHPLLVRARERSERDQTWVRDPQFSDLSSVEQGRMMGSDDTPGIFWGAVAVGVVMTTAGGWAFWHGVTMHPDAERRRVRRWWVMGGTTLVAAGVGVILYSHGG